MPYTQGKPRVKYIDRRFKGSKEEYDEKINKSKTLYIGNLSFNTSEDQIYYLFSKVGMVKNVIMGRNRYTHESCGFCFVEYFDRYDALNAIKYLSATYLDNRIIRCDIDYGFEEGRQYGRGSSGGQVRDEFRTDFDKDRGGYGKAATGQNFMKT